MLEQVWQFLVEKISGLVPVISPFWYEWLPLASLIIIGALAIGWFFSPLRQVAGAVVMATVAFLVGFRKGEKASDDKNSKEIRRLKQQRQQQQNTDGRRWW